MTTEEVIRAYYDGWLKNDRDKARSFLADNLKFRSPSDNFDSADDFFNACWKYAEDFNEMKIEHGVYDNEAGYIVYSFGDFWVGELLKIRDGKIYEAYVTFKPTH